MSINRIIVLGGYGNFGKRIVENLSSIAGISLLVAGRSRQNAEKLCNHPSLSSSKASLLATAIDINSPLFVTELEALKPDLVIHTGGPFQRQDYKVPKACISIGSHYIDLADDRRFVCDITSLNKSARDRDVVIISGASSVPGLSSTFIDSFLNEFSRLDIIDIAIAPGNKAERGEATVRGILSYTGHPFQVFCQGAWEKRYGWMSPRKLNFGPIIGKRWLANVDIPDLELFPKRYRPAHTIVFQAGLELPFLHLTMVLMAWMARFRLVRNWSCLSGPIFKSSLLFDKFGTDTGGMLITLSGLDKQQRPTTLKWTLIAENGVGPYIPTISTIILAKKLINGDMRDRGAIPCLGLYSVDDFDREASPLGIHHKMEISHR